MSTHFPRYIVVRVIGQPEFVVSANWFVEHGYRPAGGVQAINVRHPISGLQDIGFFQAMWLPESKPLVEIPEEPPTLSS